MLSLNPWCWLGGPQPLPPSPQSALGVVWGHLTCAHSPLLQPLFECWLPTGRFQESLTFATTPAFGVAVIRRFRLPSILFLGVCKDIFWSQAHLQKVCIFHLPLQVRQGSLASHHQPLVLTHLYLCSREVWSYSTSKWQEKSCIWSIQIPVNRSTTAISKCLIFPMAQTVGTHDRQIGRYWRIQALSYRQPTSLTRSCRDFRSRMAPLKPRSYTCSIS